MRPASNIFEHHLGYIPHLVGGKRTSTDTREHCNLSSTNMMARSSEMGSSEL
jgi:hypothetical protein